MYVYFIYIYIYVKVSWNRGTPKSSILVGFSIIINHPPGGVSPFQKKFLYINHSWYPNHQRFKKQKIIPRSSIGPYWQSVERTASQAGAPGTWRRSQTSRPGSHGSIWLMGGQSNHAEVGIKWLIWFMTTYQNLMDKPLLIGGICWIFVVISSPGWIWWWTTYENLVRNCWLRLNKPRGMIRGMILQVVHQHPRITTQALTLW